MQAGAPFLAAMHPMNPDHIHEELELMLPDFSSYNQEWVARAPAWRDYYLAHDQTPHYAYMKTVLQILQWYRPRERWVLKSPQHLEQLGPLIATFPDATIVVTHRDPVSVVQSAATMLTYGARTTYRTTRPEWYRDYWTDRIRRLLEASVRDRQLLPDGRTIDVLFHEFMADELGTVERIYDGAGIELTDAARAEIEAYRRDHPRGKEGQVVYDLRRDFAAKPDAVRTRSGSTSTLPRVRWRSMNIQDQVDRLIDTRPGKELLTPVYDDRAYPIVDGFIYRSGGTSASYLIVTDGGRVIVNTGMGFEAPHHKRLFDAIRPGPTHTIITTQGHVDHVGGVALFREPGTSYVAQANNPACQADDARIQRLRMRTAGSGSTCSAPTPAHPRAEPGRVDGASRSRCPTSSSRSASRYASASCASSCCAAAARRSTAASCGCPSTGSRWSATCSARCSRTSRTSTPCAATVPVRRAPSATNRMVRELRPELLITGRHEPIDGADLIDASLERLHDAVELRARRDARGINAGNDVCTLMREIRAAARAAGRPGLRQGHLGRAHDLGGATSAGSSAVDDRALPRPAPAALAELVDVAGIGRRARPRRGGLAAGDAVVAIRLGEAVEAAAPDDPRLAPLMAARPPAPARRRRRRQLLGGAAGCAPRPNAGRPPPPDPPTLWLATSPPA